MEMFFHFILSSSSSNLGNNDFKEKPKMRLTKLRLMAFTSAAALGLALPLNGALAQTETVNLTFTTTSAIASTDTSDMDFGTWVTQIGAVDAAADDVTLTLTSDGSATASAANSTDSVMIEVTAPATEGVVNVQTPAASSLTMTRSNEVGFADGNLSLTSVSYRTASEGPTVIAPAGNGPVTVVGAATDEPVNFGGEITFDDTPADGAHTASFDVTFSY